MVKLSYENIKSKVTNRLISEHFVIAPKAFDSLLYISEREQNVFIQEQQSIYLLDRFIDAVLSAQANRIGRTTSNLVTRSDLDTAARYLAKKVVNGDYEEVEKETVSKLAYICAFCLQREMTP